MASKVRNEVAVGVTVSVVLILTIYIIVTLGDWSNLTTEQKNITVQLPYQVGLKGLVKGSPIYLGGVKIGQISETKIVPPKNPNADIQVNFTMVIPKVYPLRADAVLEAGGNLFGGQVALVIQDLGRDKALLKEGDVVPLRFEGGIDDVLSSVKQELDIENTHGLMYRFKNEFNRYSEGSFLDLLVKAATNLHEITGQIKRQLDVEGEKPSLVAKLDRAMDKLNSSLDQIDSLVRENKGNISETLSSLHRTAAALENDVPEIMDKLRQPLDKADALMDDAQVALDHMKEASQSVRDLVQVNRESISRMVDNLLEVSSNMKLAAQEIRRAPWKLMHRPSKKQWRQEKVVHAADSFAIAAEQLDGVSLRLQKVVAQAQLAGDEQVDIHREQVDAMLAQLQASFQQFRDAEKVFWDELR